MKKVTVFEKPKNLFKYSCVFPVWSNYYLSFMFSVNLYILKFYFKYLCADIVS